jgi:hypothetical protein
MRARISIPVVLGLVALTGVTPARAGEDGHPVLWASPTAPAPAEPREERYHGWQLIPIDAASAALMAWGSGDARGLGVAAYLASGLVLHTVNGSGEHGARSFYTRGGLPVLAGAIGGVLGGLSGITDCIWDECGDGWYHHAAAFDSDAARFGVVAGVSMALAIDWIELSWGEAPSWTERSILAPQVIMDGQGLSLGVLGSF